MSMLSDIIAQEEQFVQQILQQINDIEQEVATTKIKGVKQISPFICVVNFSALQRDNWSPEFYNVGSQVNIVKSALDVKEKTARGTLKRIEKMIEDKGAKINNTFYPLNDTTLNILKKYI